jgi:glycosyltransferase involved in cell wall biosynthesis
VTAAGETGPLDSARPAGRLNVLIVTTTYPRFPGDFMGHFVASLAREVAREGHFVTVLAPHGPDLEDCEEADGVSVRRFRYWFDPMERVAYGDGIPTNVRHDWRAALALPAFWIRLRRKVGEYAKGADVVHVQWGPTAALAGSTLAGKPIVLTLHGSDTTLARKGGIWRRLLVAGLERASRLITVSQEQVDFLAREGLWKGHVDVLPSGVPVELTERPRPQRADDAPFTYLFAGRLLETKGVGELMEAFVLAADRVPGAVLQFAGAGPEEGALRERAASAGLTDRVRFLGALPHAEALDAIAAADVFVLPSHGEGSPLSVTEALALGTPVIGTRVGAIPDLLGEDGLLVDAGDVNGLADAMVRLAQDGPLRDALVARGRAHVRERYTWPVIAAETVRVYREALGG